MRAIFDKSRTLFEKILIIVVLIYGIVAVIGCNVNLDLIVYATFGSYVLIGLTSFIRPKILFEVLKRENEDFLVRNQRLIPYIKSGFRWGGLALALVGLALNYVFIVYF
ncbi:MAG: hypothetical protein GX207_07075 [Peptococcaceae bacterium]|nr:hypothetical protein [Peptococcaceae bacterium]